MVNTALTAAGMWLLAIPGIGLLSLFVFLCSFIPIMGCIISTVPIGFVALTEYGFVKLAMVIVMVAMVGRARGKGAAPPLGWDKAATARMDVYRTTQVLFPSWGLSLRLHRV